MGFELRLALRLLRGQKSRGLNSWVAMIDAREHARQLLRVAFERWRSVGFYRCLRRWSRRTAALSTALGVAFQQRHTKHARDVSDTLSGWITSCDDEPNILFAEGFDEAIAGVVWDGERTRVVYDTELILELLMGRSEMTYEEAVEYFDFNIAGSHMGDYTPLYLET